MIIFFVKCHFNIRPSAGINFSDAFRYGGINLKKLIEIASLTCIFYT